VSHEELSRLTTTSGGRTPRADGQRTKQRILDVARQHFADHGVSSSLDAIARDANVGAGTLYRHFPSRDALLAALLSARDEEIGIRRAAIIASPVGAGHALDMWLDALVEWAGAFDGLPEPLRAALGGGATPLTSTCEGYITGTDEFLVRAQEAGLARRDVRGRDLFLMALAVSWARGAAMADSSAATSMITIMRSGWATTSPY
jgi:AcrR family transcriptional regulator